MQLVQFVNGAASLALLLFPLHTHAELNTQNQNITLRFFQSSQEGSCDYVSSSNALTFTTSSIPLLSHCFNFADLFGGNVTQGFVNQTRNLASTVRGEAGIHWQLQNIDAYESQGNYSNILYRQHVWNPSFDTNKPGSDAERRVTIYGGKDCSEKNPNSKEELLPWYGFSCWSEDEGSCGTLPYNVASFSIQPKPKNTEKLGTCWVFAKQGAGARLSSSSQAIMGIFLSAILGLWLAM